MWWACRDTLVHRESRWQHGFVKGVVTRSCDAAVCPLLMQETSASLPWQHKEQPLPKSFDRVMQDFKVERRTHPLQCAASSSSVTWYQGKFQQSGRLQPGPMNVVRDTDHRTRSYSDVLTIHVLICENLLEESLNYNIISLLISDKLILLIVWHEATYKYINPFFNPLYIWDIFYSINDAFEDKMIGISLLISTFRCEEL